MESANNYFDLWMKSQQQAMTSWLEQAAQLQSMMQKNSTDTPFAAWSKSAFDAFSANTDGNLAKDTFAKSLAGSEAMQKLFEQWQPMLEAIRNRATDPATYKDLMDPAKVKQVVDQLFNFDLDAMSRWQQQLGQNTDLYQQFGKPWVDAMKSHTTQFSQGDFQTDTWLNNMQSMLSLFGNTQAKLFSMPAVGKDREKVELVSQFAKAMSDFIAKNVDYQRLMYDTGVKAHETLSKELAQRVEAGEQSDQFADYFALWTEINEKTFNELFHTKSFAQKRNAMTDAGFTARKLYHEIMELQLADLPVARRSEMDELYKIIYDLRKKVKKLEAQSKGQSS